MRVKGRTVKLTSNKIGPPFLDGKKKIKNNKENKGPKVQEEQEKGKRSQVVKVFQVPNNSQLGQLFDGQMTEGYVIVAYFDLLDERINDGDN
ncbi:hypothetical protein QJS10_CPB21g00872 [Acorus calamus]|uniref:Uncharacterized protein n=1 Tax=Acorus calamus TaxID=4465 RepID=A0AAV9C3S4_ACOCL|nr:hypothetical protein QJS10_CPB21g00872 [Acorus calamus]